MDHLLTSEQRRARWYSQLQPRYVPVEPAEDWEDLLLPLPSTTTSHHHYEQQYNVVKSVPMQWLLNDDIQVVHAKMRAALQYHGFLIISNVLSHEECQDCLQSVDNWIEAVTTAVEEHHNCQKLPSLRDPVVNGANKDFPKSIEGGIIPFYGSGHSSFAWKIRSHAHVLRVFESIWNTSTISDPLVTSLDGIVLWQAHHPPTDAGWFHIDQNPRNKPDFQCVQGLVNLLPVTPITGGNALVPQSHHLFPHHYCYTNSNNDDTENGDSSHPCLQFYLDRLDELRGDDWMEIDPQDTAILSPNKIISALLGPGDMLLWDSRLVHCSYPGTGCSKQSLNNNNNNNNNKASSSAAGHLKHSLSRAATMVSMMPQSKCSSQVLQQRRHAVHVARTLTHWANKVAPLGNEHASDAGFAEEASVVALIKEHQRATGKKVLLDFDDLSEQQQRLVTGSW